jgi:hypothetical protein
MQAKSDSNYVAVTRHRKFIGRNQFISSCPPIFRAIASDQNQPHISTRLDDDDIWFSSMTSFGGAGAPSSYHSSGVAAVANAADYGDTVNDGANMVSTAAGGAAGGVGDSADDLISPHGNHNPMMMESSEDITAVAPHSSVSAIVSYNERRRREDGWNDLGLETILRTNASTNGNTLLFPSSSANVVPFSSSSDGGGGGNDGSGTAATQQQRGSTNNDNDDD